MTPERLKELKQLAKGLSGPRSWSFLIAKECIEEIERCWAELKGHRELEQYLEEQYKQMTGAGT